MDKQQAQEYADALKIVCSRCLYSCNSFICSFDNCPCIRSVAQYVAAEKMDQFCKEIKQEESSQ